METIKRDEQRLYLIRKIARFQEEALRSFWRELPEECDFLEVKQWLADFAGKFLNDNRGEE